MKSNKKQNILNTLKERGARMTSVRTCMIEIFSKKKNPVSAFEILEELKKYGLRVNKTTVYREIAFLLEGKVINQISLGEEQNRYELFEEHHHHLVCQNCRRIEEIESKEIEKLLLSVEKKMKQKNKFSKILHSLEFFGVCAKCKSL